MVDLALEHSHAHSDLNVDDLADIVHVLEEMHSFMSEDSFDENHEIDEFQMLTKKIMKLIYKEDIIQMTDIITNESIDGRVIHSHSDNQQQLESYLISHFGAIWSHRKEPYASKVAESLITAPSIEAYSIEQMIDFIACYDVNHAVKVLADNGWNEEKFKASSKKAFTADLCKSQIIPIGIALKLWKKLKKALSATINENAETKSQRIVFEEEEKQFLVNNQEEKPTTNSKHVTFKDMEPPSNHSVANLNDWRVVDRRETHFPTYIAKAVQCYFYARPFE